MAPTLFTPLKLGRHTLQHRVVLAPLTRFRSDEKAVVRPFVTEYYAQRATPGGLLVTEATFISPTAGSYPNAPGIYTQEQIAKWKEVTQAVHDKGGVIYLQLWHIGRASHSKFSPNGEQPVSASAIAIQGKNLWGDQQQVPRALEILDIKALVQDYRQAALNAVEAGFDGVEIHAANGYLLDQFINTSSNKRSDIYGGSIENRARFALEVVDAIADAIGPDRTAIRLSPWSGFQDMQDDTPYETWGYIVSQLQAHQPELAYVHFVEPRIDFRSEALPDTTDSLDPFRQIWKGPFISAGGYTIDPKLAFERSDKSGDLIAFGRAFIANPDIVERLRNGWPLNRYNRKTFYTPGAEGYTDYPVYQPEAQPEVPKPSL
ncbi:uncharacterized protein BYT42DRAFT_578789 [Radiomyces spectabilis]|uniref:uncharacterized protein n=1 Tax=Radiomyces spectabilis TaxID=64574 RepID=UPI00221EE2BE|nr:uncharacterized protein BYT42DRAFT_578789 [Radiomyces spectabilis]KAI8372988.1 hypothetical protein BYT42DRAFT_578789 [Radiomyces spectabilis]